MRFRVSSSPASSGWASNASPGRPVLAFLQPRRRRICESPRIFGPFGCAGDGSSSRPEFRILQRCRFCEVPGRPDSSLLLQHLRSKPPVSLLPASPALPAMGSSSCPESLILRRCRLADLRVSPAFGPSVSPTIRFPSFPFRVRPDRESSGSGWWSPEFPRVCTFRFAIVESSGRPESSSLARRRANFQVALNLRSLGGAVGLISGSPRISFLQRSVYASSGHPDFASTAGSMMNPRLVLELCILGLRRG